MSQGHWGLHRPTTTATKYLFNKSNERALDSAARELLLTNLTAAFGESYPRCWLLGAYAHACSKQASCAVAELCISPLLQSTWNVKRCGWSATTTHGCHVGTGRGRPSHSCPREPRCDTHKRCRHAAQSTPHHSHCCACRQSAQDQCLPCEHCCRGSTSWIHCADLAPPKHPSCANPAACEHLRSSVKLHLSAHTLPARLRPECPSCVSLAASLGIPTSEGDVSWALCMVSWASRCQLGTSPLTVPCQ